MKLHTIWGFDRLDNCWSMLSCWSDENVAENRDGYEAELKEYREDGGSLTDVRVVDVDVHSGALRAALKNPVVEGKVE